MSDTLSAALRVLVDQCVWNLASQLHNERKWEFNTNFLTKSATPPPLLSASLPNTLATSKTTAESYKHLKHACPGTACAAANSNSIEVRSTETFCLFSLKFAKVNIALYGRVQINT